jgi:hypothetical protein
MLMRFSILPTLAVLAALPLAAQSAESSTGPSRTAIGIALQGLNPQGEFANNVSFAGGIGASLTRALDPQGIIAIRADLGYLVYGSERYRTPLGGGPLGLVAVDVRTTNNIVQGGLGLQLVTPGRTVRPYANASAGFSYFFTNSSVQGTGNQEAFANSINSDDGGFAWTAGSGVYVPLSIGTTPVQLDFGVKWLDNGEREYLRPDGISFENNGVQLNPVRSQAQALQFHLGLTFPLR